MQVPSKAFPADTRSRGWMVGNADIENRKGVSGTCHSGEPRRAAPMGSAWSIDGNRTLLAESIVLVWSPVLIRIVRNPTEELVSPHGSAPATLCGRSIQTIS